MSDPQAKFLSHAGIQLPIICGAMYPCSNPELVAAVSEAGGIGIVQPISLQYVHSPDLRSGLQTIRTLTSKPIGFNAIIEASSTIYLERMREWIDIALEEGIRFFVTALGKPGWVVEQVHAVGGVVYHDVTERKWAQRAIDQGVDGLICVNARAGGHAGTKEPKQLFEELSGFDVPLICAGGVGDEQDLIEMRNIGYAGVQMGTRFIATNECRVHADYHNAIVKANPEDIVLTERITGVPVAIINTPEVQKTGTKAGPLARLLLRNNRTKHWVRTYYSLTSIMRLKKSSLQGSGYKDYFQAGKSVGGIHKVEPVADIMKRFARAIASQ